MAEIDLVFVIDETGSMGSYLEPVKKNVVAIVQTISSFSDCGELRYGT